MLSPTPNTLVYVSFSLLALYWFDTLLLVMFSFLCFWVISYTSTLLKINTYDNNSRQLLLKCCFNMLIQFHCSSPPTQSFVPILVSLESENPTLQIHPQNMTIAELRPNLQSNNVPVQCFNEFLATFCHHINRKP